jgi:hypothetical protein
MLLGTETTLMFSGPKNAAHILSSHPRTASILIFVSERYFSTSRPRQNHAFSCTFPYDKHELPRPSWDTVPITAIPVNSLHEHTIFNMPKVHEMACAPAWTRPRTPP